MSYDDNVVQSYLQDGWQVISGDYKGLIWEKNYQQSLQVFRDFKPDVLLPLKAATDVWKETTRAIDITPWAGKILTFQDAFSAIRGKSQPPAPLPTTLGSTTPWFLVWGEQFKRKLLWNGYPADRIVVVGNPAWDWCSQDTPPLPRYILFLGGAPGEWLRELEFQAIHHEFGDYFFVFKDHPVQADKKYSFANQLSRLPIPMHPQKRVKIHNHKTSQELIPEAKVVITNTSSCGVEAMLCEKPVIVVRTCEESQKFANSGRVIPNTWFSFSRELRLCLQGKENRSKIPEFVKDVVFSPDGRATQRMAEFIETIEGK